MEEKKEQCGEGRREDEIQDYRLHITDGCDFLSVMHSDSSLVTDLVSVEKKH